MKTILITGCSSGFGRETARLFHDRGWRVVATMRNVQAAALPESERMTILPLDVTSMPSIAQALRQAGPIDALVNNAGIGAMGPFEGTRMETARQLFETNALGTMAVTQAVLPQFRERRSGVIVNIGSIVTAQPLPLVSAYAASKAAVDAFTASVALELAPFDVRVHLVQPGRAPSTPFGENARRRCPTDVPAAYAGFVEAAIARMRTVDAVTDVADVANAVWQAVTDPTSPSRLPAGADAIAIATTS